MDIELVRKIEKVGLDRYLAYIKSIASGDGSAVSRMASGAPGAIGPFDRISLELKEIAREIISELPTDWTDENISDAVMRRQGLR